MKPFYTKTSTFFDSAVIIRRDELSHFYKHWHYHDEYELVYIEKSTGKRFVGDSIGDFKEGDLVLLGSKLPHIWLNGPEYFDGSSSQKAIATIIHFQRRFVENDFIRLPSMNNIQRLFSDATCGVKFNNFKDIGEKLSAIQEATMTDQIILILDLLNRLSLHKDRELLATDRYAQNLMEKNQNRLTEVFEYIAHNFTNDIRLADLAQIAHMTPEAFCNYFKKKTRKTVFTYINDLKIGYSKKLLIDSHKSISQIAQESGFNSISFFNRKFKADLNITPLQYRKSFEAMDRFEV